MLLSLRSSECSPVWTFHNPWPPQGELDHLVGGRHLAVIYASRMAIRAAHEMQELWDWRGGEGGELPRGRQSCCIVL